MKTIELLESVKCGMEKWELGVSPSGTIVLRMGKSPTFAELELSEVSSDEARRLGEMFIFYAREKERAGRKPATSKVRAEDNSNT